ncbi:MAG TPA: hypothetical protein VE197_04170 [Mycobacterium sp.]|jgi:hypothetical protein|nr:hypothetical protein [Mycobacterium sp.]
MMQGDHNIFNSTAFFLYAAGFLVAAAVAFVTGYAVGGVILLVGAAAFVAGGFWRRTYRRQ